jgi:hypothetical protein
MKTATLLAGAMLLAVTSLGARQLLDLHISPSVSTAPATFKVRATVPPDADNRAITFSADSESFFRSSEVQLDGDKAPRTILWSSEIFRPAHMKSVPCSMVQVASNSRVLTAPSS